MTMDKTEQLTAMQCYWQKRYVHSRVRSWIWYSWRNLRHQLKTRDLQNKLGYALTRPFVRSMDYELADKLNLAHTFNRESVAPFFSEKKQRNYSAEIWRSFTSYKWFYVYNSFEYRVRWCTSQSYHNQVASKRPTQDPGKMLDQISPVAVTCALRIENIRQGSKEVDSVLINLNNFLEKKTYVRQKRKPESAKMKSKTRKWTKNKNTFLNLQMMKITNLP